MKTTIETAAHYSWGNGCDGWHLQNSENLSVIRECMPPAATEVFHYHRFAQQVFYILSGDAFFETEEESITISPGESIVVPAKRLHRIANHGDTAMEFLVISSPHVHGDRVEIIDYAEIKMGIQLNG